MYSFVDSQKNEFANQFVEEQVDVPSFFLLDDIADVVDFPIYDEYDDDCDVDFLEQLVVCSLSENVPFQQCNESNQPTYHSYKEESIESAEGNSLPLCFSSFKLLKENSKIIIEANECVLRPNLTDSLEQIDKILQQSSHVVDDPITCYVEGLVSSKLQPLVEDESENECVQPSKEIENCAYDNSEENEEGFESGERTLPLCFSSFKLLKKNVYNVSNQKSSRHDVEYSESNGLENENYLPLCFSSFELLKANHEITEEQGKSDCIHNGTVLHEKIVICEEDQQPSHTFNDHVVDYMEGYFSSDLQPVLSYQPEKEDEVDQEIVVKGYFPPSETNISMQQDFQQGKVFQSCLSSPENDVVVQFLNGLDMDEDSETASMETSSSEQTNYIEFQESNKTTYAIFQSEIQKDNEEAVVLFDSFKNHGFENASMGTLDCEIVHDVLFSHLQEDYEQKLISIHSFESQNDNTQANFQKINKTKSEPFDEQEDNPDAHSMVVIFKDVQGCMNVFVDMHGILDKPIVGISFESVPRTEEIEQEHTYERGLSFCFCSSRRNDFS
jgi:hypothetical protein